MTRRRWVVAIGVFTLAIGGGVSIDHAVAVRAERAVEERLDCGDVAADVRGFPVFLQVLRGELADVVIDIGQLTRQGVRVDVGAELKGVHTDGEPRIDELTLTATAPWSELGGLVEDADLPTGRLDDVEVMAEGDRIAVSLGEGLLSPRVLLSAELDGDSIVVRPSAVEVGGRELQPEILARFTGADPDQMTRRFTPQVPDGLRLTEVDVVADGLAVTAAGNDVTSGAGDAGRLCAEMETE